MKAIFCLLCACCVLFAKAQTITGAEYFIDTDPGAGNGTPIAIVSGQDVNFTVSVPTNTLSNGFHFLAVRTRDAGGSWGLFDFRGFYIATATADADPVTAAEYFIDTDPGPGNGTAVSVGTNGTTVSFTAAVPTNTLAPGFHFLGMRTKDASGKWALFENRGFYISTSVTNVTDIVAAEYFIDSDPGPGSATAIPVPSGPAVNFVASVPTNALATGFHFLAVRAKDASGNWGLLENRGFYISAPSSNMANVVSGEFFLDSDPGIGNGLPFSFASPGQNVNEVVSVQIPAGTTPGPHLLVARVKDANGYWSLFDSVRRLNVTATTLPLTFLSFNGKRVAASVALNWQTENEVNTAHFDVERSRNGLEFSTIGTVAARNAAGRHDYAFVDGQPFPGLNFYRLKQVDRNGVHKYTQVVKVYFGEAGKSELKLFPQPVQTTLYAAFGGSATHLLVQVYDAGGRTVLSERRGAASTVAIDVNGLAKGTYWIILSDGLTQQKGRFVKQ